MWCFVYTEIIAMMIIIVLKVTVLFRSKFCLQVHQTRLGINLLPATELSKKKCQEEACRSLVRVHFTAAEEPSMMYNEL